VSDSPNEEADDDETLEERLARFDEEIHQEMAHVVGDIPGEGEEEEDEEEWQPFFDIGDAPLTTHMEELSVRGEDFHESGNVPDTDIPVQLKRLVDCLAQMRVFLDGTDHLGDRALYRQLVEVTLHEPVPQIPLDENSSCHIDLSESDDADSDVFLRYYADDETREWVAREGGRKLPPKEALPFDRDRSLPKPYPENGRSGEEEE